MNKNVKIILILAIVAIIIFVVWKFVINKEDEQINEVAEKTTGATGTPFFNRGGQRSVGQTSNTSNA